MGFDESNLFCSVQEEKRKTRLRLLNEATARHSLKDKLIRYLELLLISQTSV